MLVADIVGDTSLISFSPSSKTKVHFSTTLLNAVVAPTPATTAIAVPHQNKHQSHNT
jgi:hypothetical protein